jgi:hypothetical protein
MGPAEFSRQRVHVRGTLSLTREIPARRLTPRAKTFRRWLRALVLAAGMVAGLSACATLPEAKHSWAKFPENAFLGKPKRPYDVIGVVRSKVNFQTLDPNNEESSLCRNYFNQAAKKLLEYSKDKGGDAVIEVRSVVFFMDGKTELFPRAECSDDGAEGQILAQGTAIKWKPEPEKRGK